jgi:hypothetical protein
MFLCIPHRIILWTYVDEYENHRRMVLYYIIQRTRQYVRILSRSCPHRRSTHPFLSNISIPLVLQIMSPSCCILLDHAHIVDQHITSFVDSTRLVLQDYEHVMLHTPRSYTHWRSTHPFLRRFDSHTIKRLWAHCILLDHSHIEDQHIIPSFVNSILLVLKDHEHIAYYSIMATLETIRNGYYLTYHSRSPYRAFRWFII